MKAILIDSTLKQIYEVEGNFQDYREIAKFLNCQYIEGATTFENQDTIFVDEEGLFNNHNTAFKVAGSHQPYFVGSGIVVGHTIGGNSRNVKSTIEKIEKLIKFL